MLNRLAYLVGMVMCLAFLLPDSAAAQGCGHYCEGGVIFGCPCIEGQHQVIEYPLFNNTTGLHDDCRDNPGGHGSCFAAAGDLRSQAAYDKLIDAAVHRDVEAILALAVDLPEFVQVNRQRSNVMLRTCDGSGFVAALNLPAGEGHVLALAARVEKLQV